MTNKNNTTLLVEEEILTEETNMLFDYARQIMLAGLGLVDYGQEKIGGAQEEMLRFFGDMVERGTTVEETTRTKFNEVIESRKQQAKEATDKAESEFDKRLEEIANRLNLPSNDDVKALTKKLNALSRKLDELKKAQATA